MSTQPISMWETTATEEEAAPDPLCGGLVDVAIVGGGYTGLSTALHCAGKGLSVQVIEAERIGFGGSGRNVGLVNPAAWLPPDRLIGLLGPEYGPRFVERFGAAPAKVFELIERHRIRCEATRTGTLHAARSKGGLRELRGRFAEWRRLGAPVELIDRDGVHEMTGSPAFLGALLDRRAGTINPMAYCRGLARAAAAAGATISTGVRATGLGRDGSCWQVGTDRGPVRARNVVLGTNAYTDGLWPGLGNILSVINYLQVATRPLGADAACILPGRQGLWDTGRIMSNLRRDGEGRLLIGTMGRVIGSAGGGLTHRWALKHVSGLFPALGPVEFERAWHGRIAMTPDHLPRIHRLGEGVWTAIGYNGRGITTGTLFGESIAGLLTGLDPKELPLPVTEFTPPPRPWLRPRMFDMAFTAGQLVRSF